MTAHRVELAGLSRGQKTRAAVIAPFVPLIVLVFLAHVAVREAWRAFMDVSPGWDE